MFECFSEYVGDVIISVNVFQCDFAHVYTFSEEVVFYVDMLDTLMEGWIFG